MPEATPKAARMKDLRVQDLRAFLAHPAVVGATLLDLRGTQISGDWLLQLLDADHLTEVSEIDLSGFRVSPTEAQALFRTSALPSLSRLTLGGMDLEAAWALLSPKTLTGRVFLGEVVVGLLKHPDPVALMAEFGDMGRVGQLTLQPSRTGYAREARKQAHDILSSPSLAGLRALSAVGARGKRSRPEIDDEAIAALAQNPALTSLRTLHLREADLGGPGIRALGTSTHLKNLHTLTVKSRAQPAELASLAMLPALTHLDLTSTEMPEASDLSALVSTRLVGGAEHLSITSPSSRLFCSSEHTTFEALFGHIDDSFIAGLGQNKAARRFKTMILSGRFSPAAIEQLLDDPAFGKVTTLNLSLRRLSAQTLDTLVGSPQLTRFTRVCLSDPTARVLISRKAIEVRASSSDMIVSLAGSKHLRTSRSWSISGVYDSRAISSLAASEQMRAIERLSLDPEGGLASNAITALATTTRADKLRTLILGAAPNTRDALGTLARAPGLAGLKSLKVNKDTLDLKALRAHAPLIDRVRDVLYRRRSTATWWRLNEVFEKAEHGENLALAQQYAQDHLAEWPDFMRSTTIARLRPLEHDVAPAMMPLVRTLDASGRRLTEANINTIARVGPYTRITHFNLEGTGLDVKKLLSLGESKRFGALTDLNISRNAFGNRGLARFVQTKLMTRLKKLEVRGCNIDAGGIASFVAHPSVQGLTRLNLADNPIGDAGARTLADAEHLASLGSLNIGGCGITQAGLETLCNESAFDGLESLTMLGVPISPLALATICTGASMRNLYTLLVSDFDLEHLLAISEVEMPPMLTSIGSVTLTLPTLHDLPRLLSQPGLLRHFHALHLCTTGDADDLDEATRQAAALLSQCDLGPVGQLKLSGGLANDTVLLALASNKRPTGLHQISLAGRRNQPPLNEGLRALGHAIGLQNLNSMGWSSCPVDAEALTAFLNSPKARDLEWLRFYQALPIESLRAFADNRHLTKLRTLYISNGRDYGIRKMMARAKLEQVADAYFASSLSDLNLDMVQEWASILDIPGRSRLKREPLLRAILTHIRLDIRG